MEDNNNVRDLCKPLADSGVFFSAFDLKKLTKITPLEKLCLAFIKKKYEFDEVENTVLVYKVFKGKVYILNHFKLPPRQWICRHSFPYNHTL